MLLAIDLTVQIFPFVVAKLELEMGSVVLTESEAIFLIITEAVIRDDLECEYLGTCSFFPYLSIRESH
jgi:hypothetical protein